MFYLNVKFLIMYIVISSIFYANENNEAASNIWRVPFAGIHQAISLFAMSFVCMDCSHRFSFISLVFIHSLRLFLRHFCISSCLHILFGFARFFTHCLAQCFPPSHSAFSSLFSTLTNFNNFIKFTFFFYSMSSTMKVYLFTGTQIQLCGAFNIQAFETARYT